MAQLKSKDQSHLPPSLRLGPDDVPLRADEEAAVQQAGGAETWLCHTCAHAVVVAMEGVRGKRTFCEKARGEMRSIRECNRFRGS